VEAFGDQVKYVMGLDAGFTSMGCIIFSLEDGDLYYRNAHTIRTEKQTKKKNMRVADDDTLRILDLVDGMYEFITNNIQAGDRLHIVAELPTGGAQGARANRTMGIATGVVVSVLRLLAKYMNVTVEYVTPTEVKVSATGNKSASKDEMMEWFVEVMADCGDEWATMPKVVLEHIADAYGAVTHAWLHSELFSIFKTS
jgi:Holliday junction resolvasome RuvABC endonuclease subunit